MHGANQIASMRTLGPQTESESHHLRTLTDAGELGKLLLHNLDAISGEIVYKPMFTKSARGAANQ